MEPKPKIGVTGGKGASENQDCRRLGKIWTIIKDLWITHPTNASIKNHFGSDIMSKSTMQKSFGPLKTRTNFVHDGTITKNEYVL